MFNKYKMKRLFTNNLIIEKGYLLFSHSLKVLLADNLSDQIVRKMKKHQ